MLRHGGPHKCPTHRVLWDTVQFVRLLSTGACCGALAVANYSYEAVLGMDHCLSLELPLHGREKSTRRCEFLFLSLERVLATLFMLLNDLN